MHIENLIDLLPCTIFWKDRQGVYQGCNKTLLSSFGFDSEAEVLGKTIFDLFPKNIAERVNEIDNEIMRSGKPKIIEEEDSRSPPSRFYLSNKIPLFDSNKKVIGLLGVSFEITEYKAHEKLALKQKLFAEDTLSKIINLLPGHVYWYDLDGTIYGMNNQQAKALGFNSAQDAIGKDTFAVIKGEEARIIKDTNLKVVKEEKTILAEEPFIYPDGHRGIFLSTKAPWYDQDSKPIGIIGVSLDITKQKNLETQLEIALGTAEKTLGEIIATLPGNIYWYDKKGILMGCNDSQAKLFGFDKGINLIGKDIYKIVEEQFGQPVLKQLKVLNQSIMAEGKVVTTEEEILSGDKKLTYLSKKAPLRNEKGEAIGIIGISYDITDQKQAEELRHKNAINEEKMETMRLLAASIAHEIRTPLAAIQAISSVVQNILPTLLEVYDDAVKAEHVKKALRASQLDVLKSLPDELNRITSSANTFIDMLLAKVNFESFQDKHLDLSRLSMRDVLMNAIRQYPLDEFSAQLLQPDYRKSFEFMGDEVLFQHVIFNLLKNAIYYVRAAGRPGKIEIWCEQQQDHNILHFKDTGKGIPKDILPNIFSSFYTRTRHGTGVGLAFCKMIIESFGGKIQCDSIEDQYTHFKLSFPKVENLRDQK